MANNKLQENIHITERKLTELSIQVQRLDRDYESLLKQWGLTPEEVKEFVEEAAHFSPSVWEDLQNEKKQMDEKLNLELSNVLNGNKIKQVLSEKGKIQQHWLFVR